MLPKTFTESQMDEENSKTKTWTPITAFTAVDGLIDELGTWQEAIKCSYPQGSFTTLNTFLNNAYSTQKVYPPPGLIFNAFRLTPITKVKAVIIGFEPYHQPGQSNGLSFSVFKGVKVPASLSNMYKSLESDPNINEFKRPNHGDLTKWAEQGVFLLGATLTVQDSTPSSHRKEWSAFTDAVINIINNECDKVVFMLWGKDAEKKAAGIDENKHHVLKTSHPSPLSYSRGFDKAYHFSKCNEYLKDNGIPEINWNLD